VGLSPYCADSCWLYISISLAPTWPQKTSYMAQSACLIWSGCMSSWVQETSSLAHLSVLAAPPNPLRNSPTASPTLKGPHRPLHTLLLALLLCCSRRALLLGLQVVLGAPVTAELKQLRLVVVLDAMVAGALSDLS
jgi:hypothetical protein